MNKTDKITAFLFTWMGRSREINTESKLNKRIIRFFSKGKKDEAGSPVGLNLKYYDWECFTQKRLFEETKVSTDLQPPNTLPAPRLTPARHCSRAPWPLRICAAAATRQQGRKRASSLTAPSGSLPPTPPELPGRKPSALTGSCSSSGLKLGGRQDAGKGPALGLWGDGENWGERREIVRELREVG